MFFVWAGCDIYIYTCTKYILCFHVFYPFFQLHLLTFKGSPVRKGELSTTSQTLEDTVAEAQQQNEELHQPLGVRRLRRMRGKWWLGIYGEYYMGYMGIIYGIYGIYGIYEMMMLPLNELFHLRGWMMCFHVIFWMVSNALFCINCGILLYKIFVMTY